MKLAHNGHDIEVRAIVLERGEWGVEGTIGWLDGAVENKKKFGLPYGIFSSQNDAETWGLLAAVRWIDAGKPDAEPFMTAH